jgi:hypothetical protein
MTGLVWIEIQFKLGQKPFNMIFFSNTLEKLQEKTIKTQGLENSNFDPLYHELCISL